MRHETIRDLLGTEKELTAAEVRKLPVGARVIRHSLERSGEHKTLRMTVVQEGRRKGLAYWDVRSCTAGILEIAKETERMCYTKEE